MCRRIVKPRHIRSPSLPGQVIGDQTHKCSGKGRMPAAPTLVRDHRGIQHRTVSVAVHGKLLRPMVDGNVNADRAIGLGELPVKSQRLARPVARARDRVTTR